MKRLDLLNLVFPFAFGIGIGAYAGYSSHHADTAVMPAPVRPTVIEPADQGPADLPALSPLVPREKPRAGIEETTEPGPVKPPEPPPAPQATDRLALGKLLFADPILSESGRVSCSTCHQEAHGFASKGKPLGTDGKELDRDAPSLIGIGRRTSFFWDGRARTLSEQLRAVIGNPREMGPSFPEAARRALGKYAASFQTIYGKEGTEEDFIDCLVAFEESLDRKTAWDEYVNGQGTMTPEQARGWDLFRGKAGCYRCHSGPDLTDNQFHNTGIGSDRPNRDKGRALVTRRSADLGKMRTPSLRGVSLTRPYGHDGSVPSLQRMVEHYNQGGPPDPYTSSLLRPLGLTRQEVSDLVEFLKLL